MDHFGFLLFKAKSIVKSQDLNVFEVGPPGNDYNPPKKNYASANERKIISI